MKLNLSEIQQRDWTPHSEILVCGGRDFAKHVEREHPDWEKHKKEYNFLSLVLDSIAYDPHDMYEMPRDNVIIIQGGARGADQAADNWATVRWIPVKEYRADWDKYGKGAGPIRNKQMIEEGKPDLVVAFPGGKGTANMVQLATKAGITTIEVTYND